MIVYDSVSTLKNVHPEWENYNGFTEFTDSFYKNGITKILIRKARVGSFDWNYWCNDYT